MKLWELGIITATEIFAPSKSDVVGQMIHEGQIERFRSDKLKQGWSADRVEKLIDARLKRSDECGAYFDDTALSESSYGL